MLPRKPARQAVSWINAIDAAKTPNLMCPYFTKGHRELHGDGRHLARRRRRRRRGGGSATSAAWRVSQQRHADLGFANPPSFGFALVDQGRQTG